MIIYKATNKINNKIYIGQTIHDLKIRRRQHENAHLYPSSVGSRGIFSRAINKYGKENFKWEVIDRAESLEELNKKEEYWIEKCNSLKEGGWGYNIKRGGDNHKHAERTKKLIGLAQVGEKNHMYGKVGELNPTSRPVKDMQTNKIYSSATECALDLGLIISKICAVCRGDRGSTGGRVFRYIDEDGNVIENESSKKQHRRRVVNTYTGEIFKNADEATISTGRKSGSNLSKHLKAGNGVCYLFDIVWCYENTDKEKINNFVIPKKNKPYEKLSKQVKNITTGEVFDSIAEAARSVDASKSGLARALKVGEGECKFKNCQWKLL